MKLSDNQKKSIANAINSKSPVTIKLSVSELTRKYYLPLTSRQITKINKANLLNKGIGLKLSKPQLLSNKMKGSSFFGSIASLVAKTLSKALPGVNKIGNALLPGLANRVPYCFRMIRN